MSVLFVGDIAYPYHGAVNTDSLKDLFQNHIAVGNLEGPVLSEPDKASVYDHQKYNIYSGTSVLDILGTFNFKSVSIANNHFCDFKQHDQSTIRLLKENGIGYFGAKEKNWDVVTENGVEYAIYGAYTTITGGNTSSKAILNKFDPQQALLDIAIYRSNHPQRVIIAYVHWGYELADYPQPADREWARQAIDLGANAIIGHHPHVVQGVERYKSGVIAYSLGNFILPQVNYLGKQLSYKSSRVLHELCLEISFDKKLRFTPHFFQYDLEKKDLTKVNGLGEKSLLDLTPFQGFSENEYLEWFEGAKEPGRYPTYVSYDYAIQNNLNDIYIKGLKSVRKAMIMANLHKPF